ncbi:alpha/beta hydrolase [Aquimarina litoralis]|uniref:alpha/beta hydrolase n=1 Tax=Aquimarina litoralis TaxID=584605 RepID=UPI001C56311C|nr:alpha/beta fold hydrolase [Aquimarina litoralis]MBW1294853.1 alpha/beta fold hydrolase [Aquimarina litoralis]
MLKKILKIATVFIILVGTVVGIYVHKIAPYAIIKPLRVNENLTPIDLGLESDVIEINGADTTKLKGYWIKSKLDTLKGAVIFVHGIGSCKEHGLGVSKLLSEQGIASIVFDGRAHGESTGEFTTYGFHEKKDISKIVDWIKAKNNNIKIGIWGNSLGGAIALQALEFDPRIEFGVIESTFTEMDQIVYDYSKKMMKGIIIKPISDYALKRAGEIANFDPNQVKPINSVTKIEQPILIAHGDADLNISVTYGKQLFDNLKSTDKELIVVKDGGHLDLAEKGGPEYTAKLMKFIHQRLE